MRGRQSKNDLQFDPEIERTARANQRAFRLSKSVPLERREQISNPTPSVTTKPVSPEPSIMGDAPPRPKLGDYGLATHWG